MKTASVLPGGTAQAEEETTSCPVARLAQLL
ncbi:MAG: hypothetical protein RIR25_2038, partial [Verrucomicrobiota bacterium]